MKNIFLYLLLIVIISGCEKKGNNNGNRICYYKKYEPNIAIEKFSSYSVDIDDDKTDDIIFSSNLAQFGISVISSSNNTEISKGIEPFSGSYHTIKFNDLIEAHLDWNQTLSLSGTINDIYYGEQIDYLGIKKKMNGSQNYYGWLRFITTDSTFLLVESFYLKCSDCQVKAGIINDTCKLN